MRSTLISLFVVVLFSFLGAKTLFHDGLFTAHDIRHQVARIYYYNQAIKDGQFPPYWISTLAKGYGYPLFFFSYNFPWLIGVCLLDLGVGIDHTIKFLFFISYMFSGIFMFLFIKSLLKSNLAAITSAVIYLWAPYHFLIILVGASMGIAFTFTFLPLLFLGTYLISNPKKTKIGVVTTSLALAGVILSHLITLLTILIPLTLFVFWIYSTSTTRNHSELTYLKNLLLANLLGIGLSAFYLLPAVFYNNQTISHHASGFLDLYKNNFINFNQLVYSKWGYSPIVKFAKAGEISFSLGAANWLAIIILIIGFFKFIPKAQYKFLAFLIISFITSILFMLDISMPLWDLIEKIIIFDFPFRFLLPAVFLSSIMAAVIIKYLTGYLKITFFCLLLVTAIYSNRNNTRVNLYTFYPLSDYLSTETTTNSFNEYLPENASQKLLSNSPQLTMAVKILEEKQDTLKTSTIIEAKNSGMVSFHQFGFPGQTAYLDKIKVNYTTDKYGLIKLDIPTGFHTVLIKFEGTKVITLAKIISLVSILVLLWIILRRKRYGYQTP